MGPRQAGSARSARHRHAVVEPSVSRTVCTSSVDVHQRRLQPRPLRLLRGPREQLAEVGEGIHQLAVVGQRHLVDVGRRACERLAVEVPEPGGEHLELGVEQIISDRAVDVSVLLGARAVDVVGASASK